MRPALALLCALAVLGGCSFNDCSFETAQQTIPALRVTADGSGVGDTLTVAFITDADPSIQVTTGAGVGIDPPPAAEGTVEVVFDAVAMGLAANQAARRLVATPRGDTLFVYVEGSLEPSMFALTCSLPLADVEVDVRAILVPEGTVAARVATISASEVSPSAAAAFRAAEDLRRVSRPIHT